MINYSGRRADRQRRGGGGTFTFHNMIGRSLTVALNQTNTVTVTGTTHYFFTTQSMWGPQNAADWANYAAIYRMFRVKGCRYTWHPVKPSGSNVATVSGANNLWTSWPVHCGFDMDSSYGTADINSTTLLSVIDQYASAKVRDWTRPFSIYAKFPARGLQIGYPDGWQHITTALAVSQTYPGYFFATSCALGLGTGMVDGDLLGYWRLKWYVKFGNRGD